MHTHVSRRRSAAIVGTVAVSSSLALSVASAPAASADTAPSPIRYVATNIDYVPKGLTAGDVTSSVWGMSSNGYIAANAMSTTEWRAYPYLVRPNGKIVPLTTVKGSVTQVRDVNARGYAIGVAYSDTGYRQVMWKKPNAPVVLAGPFFVPEEFGDGGDVIGRTSPAGKYEPTYPAVRRPNGAVVVAKKLSTWLHDVDRAGTVVGEASSRAAIGRRTPDLTPLAGTTGQYSSIRHTSPSGRYRLGTSDGGLVFFDARGRRTPLAGAPAGGPVDVTDRGAVIFASQGDVDLALWQRGSSRPITVASRGTSLSSVWALGIDERLTIAVNASRADGKSGAYRLVPAR